jgi:GLPGLI family protein
MKINILKLVIIPVLFFLNYLEKDKLQEEKTVCVVYKIVKPQEDNDGERQNKTNKASKETTTKLNNIREQMYAAEFELYYNKSRSIYGITDKLEINNDYSSKISKILSGGDIKRFKDVVTKEKMYQIETSGEKFNVKLPYDDYIWNITSETKIINGYKCYKATSYKEEFDKIRNRKNTFNPVVWFTPEIPASFGPAGLDGLPGLVLEGSTNGKLFFFASKIDFNCKSKIKIEKPSQGRNVTEEEYLDIIFKNFSKN